MLRRTLGFDVPDFLAAGPRDVMVAQSGVATAREILLQSELISSVRSPGPRQRSGALRWLRRLRRGS